MARGVHIVQLSKTYREPKTRTDNTTAANTTAATPSSAANTTNTEPSTSGTDVPYKYREGAERHRIEAQGLVSGPLLTFSQTTLSAPDWSKKFRMKVSKLSKLTIFPKLCHYSCLTPTTVLNLPCSPLSLSFYPTSVCILPYCTCHTDAFNSV